MKIRTIISATMILSALGGAAASAAWEDDRAQNQRWEEHLQAHHDAAPAPAPERHHWSRGEKLSDQYKDHKYEITDWKKRHWKAPPRGYHYVQTDEGDIVLAAIATGVIADIALSAQR